MKILTNFDFNQNQILNVVLQKLAAAPSSPVSGQMYFNTAAQRAYVFNGTKWLGSDALDAVMSGADIVTAINDSDSTIVDLRLSAAARSAISKAHDVHLIGDVTGLQNALDLKADKTQVLTNVPIDAQFTDTLYTKGSGLLLNGNTFSVDFGSVANTVPHGNDIRFTNARAPLAHTHGGISNDGKIGNVSGLILKTGTGGIIEALLAGTTGQFLSHNGTWATPVNTTYSVFSSSANGLVPKSTSGEMNSFLRSDGVWVSKSTFDYTIPVAGTSLGGIKSGTDITVDASGNVHVNDNSHDHTTSNITGLDTTLNGLATKVVAQDYATTAQGNAKTYTDGAISALVDTAPGTLDTLNELATALGNDPNFATTITNELANRTKKFSQSLPTGTSIIVTHNLNTRDLGVTLRQTGSPYAQVMTDIEFTTVNTITVKFAVAPTANEYTITVVG